MLCGQEALGGRADSPQPTESWRKAIGLQSPSSGTEVIYGSPEEVWEEEGEEEQEWYEESPEPEPVEREPLSPATQKRLNDEFKRDVDECTTDSDFMSGQERKTLSEIDEKIADYHRKVKESRMQAMHRRRMEGNALQYMIAPFMYLRMPLHAQRRRQWRRGDPPKSPGYRRLSSYRRPRRRRGPPRYLRLSSFRYRYLMNASASVHPRC